MNWTQVRIWFWKVFKPNRARGIKAAETRKRNRFYNALAQQAGYDSLADATEAEFNKAFGIVQPPSQVPPPVVVINNEVAS